MMTDLILAIAHHLLAFSLLGILFAQYAIVRPGLAGAALNRVRMFDRFYGLFAGLLIVAGVLRLIYGLKGPDFYLPNPVFWAKMAAFLAVGLLSIPPTLRILAWGRRASGRPRFRRPRRRDLASPYLARPGAGRLHPDPDLRRDDGARHRPLAQRPHLDAHLVGDLAPATVGGEDRRVQPAGQSQAETVAERKAGAVGRRSQQAGVERHRLVGWHAGQLQGRNDAPDLLFRVAVARQRSGDLGEIDRSDQGAVQNRFDQIAAGFVHQGRDQGRSVEDDLHVSRFAARRFSAMKAVAPNGFTGRRRTAARAAAIGRVIVTSLR